MPQLNRSAQQRRRWRLEMMIKQAALCHWCKEQMQTGDPQGADYATFEHLQRRRHGGRSNKANLVLACRQCNERRA